MKNISKDEPAYENCDIIKEFTGPKFDYDKVENTPPPLPEKRKIGRSDNVYENIGYIQECLQSNSNANNGLDCAEPEKVKSAPEEENKNETLFRSTFSIVVGSRIQKEVASIKVNEPLLKLDLKEAVTHNEVSSQNVEDDDDDEDGSFKSLYAKSLMDSYRQHSNVNSLQTSPVEDTKILNLKPLTNENTLDGIADGFTLQKEFNGSGGCSHSTFSNGNVSESNSIEHLESRIVDLTDRMNHKDVEIKKLKQEVLALKLECNHSRSEDSSSLLSPNIPSGRLTMPISSNWTAKNVPTPPPQSHNLQPELILSACTSILLLSHHSSKRCEVWKTLGSRQ